MTSVLGLAGCDSALDEVPPSQRRVDDFYQNERQARIALDGVYSALWQEGMYRDGEYPVNLVELSGEVLEEGPTQDEERPFDEYAWTPGDRLFQDFWASSYLGINRANTLISGLAEANIDEAVSAQISGQARFLRALYYFNLVRAFGGVPLYTEPVTDASQAEAPRSAADEVYGQIITDLQTAEGELSPYEEPDQEGQATVGAVRALLAKVYLQRKDWQNAADMARQVMDMGVYRLFEDYGSVFDQATENGAEHIFSVQYLDNQGSSSLAESHIGREFGPPTTSLPDGTRIRFALDRNLNDRWIYEAPYFEEMPNSYRRWMSARRMMPFYFVQATGALVRDTAALDYPAGVKFYDVLVPLSGLSQEAFRSAVLRERGLELGAEGHRRWDLLRHGLLIERNADKGAEPHHRLYPIPSLELTRNPNLEQNPDY